ncbi:MAG: T9SS type A sorting domain-containing protein, partial [Bacteroidales bacterium]
VLDESGKRISEKTAEGQLTSVSLRGLPAGFYIFLVKTDGGIIVKRAMKIN